MEFTISWSAPASAWWPSEILASIEEAQDFLREHPDLPNMQVMVHENGADRLLTAEETREFVSTAAGSRM